MSATIADQGTPTGCPSTSVYRCNHCSGLFCCTCCEPSTCDGEVGVKTIGHWYCDAPACLAAESLCFGTPAGAAEARHVRRRKPHPGNQVTEAQLHQLSLLGLPPQQEEARVALDGSRPRWRQWLARERCAGFLRLDEPACPTCGKPGHRPMDHAGWDPTRDPE